MTGLLRGKLKAFLLIGTMFALMAAIACQGERGPVGATGAPGAPGNPGNSGAPGTPGESGTSGDDGDAGAPGDAGTPGNPGNSGAPGSPGSPGNPGATGAAGKDGADGNDGADGSDGTTLIAGIVVFDASGPSTGAAEITAGAASITVIGGGYAAGELISVSAKPGKFDFLLGDAVANDHGAFSVTVDIEIQGEDGGSGFPAGEVFTVTAAGDQGNRGASAFMLVDKIDG
ncbi:MAG TPA: collagen-like protein [Dehalococcoidia bacterium]|nr:collagen-like protein [Dehalococcoidia bacterium]